MKQTRYLLWLPHGSRAVQIRQVVHAGHGHSSWIMVPIPRVRWRGEQGLLVGQRSCLQMRAGQAVQFRALVAGRPWKQTSRGGKVRCVLVAAGCVVALRLASLHQGVKVKLVGVPLSMYFGHYVLVIIISVNWNNICFQLSTYTFWLNTFLYFCSALLNEIFLWSLNKTQKQSVSSSKTFRTASKMFISIFIR